MGMMGPAGIPGIRSDKLSNVRYQLLHRTASAIIEARRFTANNTLMLVNSFSEAYELFVDFVVFARLYGIDAQPNRIVYASSFDGVNLYLGWISDKLPDRQSPLKKGTVTARKCPHCGHHEIGITDEIGLLLPPTSEHSQNPFPQTLSSRSHSGLGRRLLSVISWVSLACALRKVMIFLSRSCSKIQRTP